MIDVEALAHDILRGYSLRQLSAKYGRSISTLHHYTRHELKMVDRGLATRVRAGLAARDPRRSRKG